MHLIAKPINSSLSIYVLFTIRHLVYMTLRSATFEENYSCQLAIATAWKEKKGRTGKGVDLRRSFRSDNENTMRAINNTKIEWQTIVENVKYDTSMTNYLTQNTYTPTQLCCVVLWFVVEKK